jgi:hypothetical protein
MRDEKRTMIKKISRNLNLYDEALENSRRMVKRYFPLHRQLKHIYKQNRRLKAEIEH